MKTQNLYEQFGLGCACKSHLVNTYPAELILQANVIDATTQQPLPNANIRIVGRENVGTITDAQGNFSMTVKANESIKISYVGYETEVIPANQVGTTLPMLSKTEALDAVVITTKPKINYKKYVGFGLLVLAIAYAVNQPQKAKL